MEIKIRAIDVKTGDSLCVDNYTLEKEEIEALVVAKFRNDHRITETENIVYRAEIKENVNT